MDRQHRLQDTRGLHPHRLSSTPIKSPSMETLHRRCSSDGVSVESEAFLVRKTEDTLQNKERIETKEGVDERECSDQEGAVNTGLFRGTMCFSEQSNPPYDKQSYENGDEDDDGETDSVLSHASSITSTVMEDKGRVVFDDDDTWNDLEDTLGALPGDASVVTPVSTATAPERPLLRKVAVSKVVETDVVAACANLEPDRPPAFQLMTRLFPSLKPRTQSEPASLPPAAADATNTVEETGEARNVAHQPSAVPEALWDRISWERFSDVCRRLQASRSILDG